MNKIKLSALLILCSVPLAQAQNSRDNTSHYEALEKSTWDGVLGYRNRRNKQPLTWQEIGIAPVEFVVAVGGSKLVRNYLRNREYNIWKSVIPEVTQPLDKARTTFNDINKVWKIDGKTYDDLEYNFVRARDGYTYTTFINTGKTSISVSHTVDPDPKLAKELSEAMKQEGNRLGKLFTDYQSATSTLNAAEEKFEKASDKILTNAETMGGEAQAIGKSVKTLRFFNGLARGVEVLFIVDASLRTIVLLDGRHPGVFPTIPLAKATPAALKEFFSDFF